MKAGHEIAIEPTQLDEQGHGVAWVDGREVHVRGLFPSERGTVRIASLSRQSARAFGVLRSVTTPHASRREPPCPRHESNPEGACGGCPLMALGPEAQRELKRTELVRVGLPVERVEHDAANADGLDYRWSSKRVFGGVVGTLTLGSHAYRSARIADMAGCLVDHMLIESTFSEIAYEASQMRLAAASTGGPLRYAWAKTNGTDVLLALVTAPMERAVVQELAERLKVPHAVAWSVQEEHANAMRGGEPIMLRGAPRLEIAVDHTASSVGPLDFLQPNPKVAAMAHRALTENAAGQPIQASRAWDLYAGTGRTTALLRRGIGEVVPCESFPSAAQLLGVAPADAETFLSRMLREGPAPDLIVANPPRAGLEGAATLLAASGTPEVRIMSCYPATLTRDLAVLAPNYTVKEARAFDTLPQTAHIEVVVTLMRRD